MNVSQTAPAPAGDMGPEPAPAAVRASFPIVGIGASAGGLAAFEAFFSGMPATGDPGMAFVLVQHLAPDHESLLSSLIRRCTRMQVFDVVDGILIAPNCAYIIPPNCDMALLGGALHLLEPSSAHGPRLSIDFFFRSLAQDLGERAIGIVLSGTGSDGTAGARAIKGEGGLVMAQAPASSEFDGMPSSVIATGLVDFVLPAEQMAAQLIAYANRAPGLQPGRYAAASTLGAESALKRIFVLLRAQTRHDFSQYKPSTIHRRIERRMAVHQIGDIDNYVKFLQRTPAEIEALFRDLLIGVTSFFRDPEVFAALEADLIPKLFAQRAPGSTLRVWSTGCSTGEEAYSIAILLQERMDMLKQNYTIQVFATDIDSRAIATARAGLYPASIAGDITTERLARYFSPEADGTFYRIHKSIRDMLVFSEQDLIRDPPFSRLDLISCRNLLIYLGADLQKKLIPLFHYALNPDAYLFLGTSEGIGEYGELFGVIDRKSKFFQRKDDFHGGPRAYLGRMLPSVSPHDPASPVKSSTMKSPQKMQLRGLAERALLQHFAPSAALVDAQGDILYLHGRTGMYLELVQGEVSVNNILAMAREGLQRGLTLAFQQAVASKDIVHAPGLQVRTNGHFTRVDLTVCPVAAPHLTSQLYLVILENPPPETGTPTPVTELDYLPADAAAGDAESRIAGLKQELRIKDEYLRTTNAELERSNEELKSSNEEMQSVNEELQSANEELETSKEELQSVNEELATVNAELQAKVFDLSRANGDMNNLLAGTGIGTIFVDHKLRILRFTPAASIIINLIASDVGRPVAHIASNLVGYDNLVADIKNVLDTLEHKEVTAQTSGGQWYTLRLQPYRTLDNVIEGAVITFIDISDMVRVRDELRKANEMLRLAVVVRDSHDAITVQGLDGSTLAWNPGAVRLYGWSEAEALAMNVNERMPPALRTQSPSALLQLAQRTDLAPQRTERLNKLGQTIAVAVVCSALVNEQGRVYAIATTERAIGSDE